MKWYDYGYLEEIEVQREDQKHYKFKEGDFPRLHLYDIEDRLLLLVQKKLSNLERDVIFDLGVALRMFTKCIVILRRVEELNWCKLVSRKLPERSLILQAIYILSDITNIIHTLHTNTPQEISIVDKYKKTVDSPRNEHLARYIVIGLTHLLDLIFHALLKPEDGVLANKE
ncbi:hypothetical protein Tco_0555328 [Tanacetum coccineum]